MSPYSQINTVYNHNSHHCTFNKPQQILTASFETLSWLISVKKNCVTIESIIIWFRLYALYEWITSERHDVSKSILKKIKTWKICNW